MSDLTINKLLQIKREMEDIALEMASHIEVGDFERFKQRVLDKIPESTYVNTLYGIRIYENPDIKPTRMKVVYASGKVEYLKLGEGGEYEDLAKVKAA